MNVKNKFPPLNKFSVFDFIDDLVRVHVQDTSDSVSVTAEDAPLLVIPDQVERGYHSDSIVDVCSNVNMLAALSTLLNSSTFLFGPLLALLSYLSSVPKNAEDLLFIVRFMTLKSDKRREIKSFLETNDSGESGAAVSILSNEQSPAYSYFSKRKKIINSKGIDLLVEYSKFPSSAGLMAMGVIIIGAALPFAISNNMFVATELLLSGSLFSYLGFVSWFAIDGIADFKKCVDAINTVVNVGKSIRNLIRRKNKLSFKDGTAEYRKSQLKLAVNCLFDSVLKEAIFISLVISSFFFIGFPVNMGALGFFVGVALVAVGALTLKKCIEHKEAIKNYLIETWKDEDNKWIKMGKVIERLVYTPGVFFWKGLIEPFIIKPIRFAESFIISPSEFVKRYFRNSSEQRERIEKSEFKRMVNIVVPPIVASTSQAKRAVNTSVDGGEPRYGQALSSSKAAIR